MEAQSWPSLVLTSASLLAIQGNQRVTAYKHDTRLRSSDCMFSFPTRSSYLPYFFPFAQNRQGCTRRKRFRRRREHVRQESPPTFRGVYTILLHDLDPKRSMLVVSPRSCKRYARSCHRTSYSNNALCTPFLPILRLQYSRGNRG